MTERRYTELEVAAIFQRAAETPPPTARGATSSSAPAEGLTLTDLQSIGRDVGIPADAIALAARAVGDAGAPTRSRTIVGLPVGVTHTVELGRRLTEDEWERLVVDLRETFDARGRVTSHGSLREWTNGNLQALLEPTESGGHRLRLRTTKGNALGGVVGGLGMVGVSAVMLIAAAAQGALFADVGTLTALGAVGLTGAGMLGSNVLQLPRWARTRRQQMEAVAARAVARTAEPAIKGGPAQLPPADGR